MTRTPSLWKRASRSRSFSMGVAFCHPKITPVLPVAFASRMSCTVVTCDTVSERSRNRRSHCVMLSIVSA